MIDPKPDPLAGPLPEADADLAAWHDVLHGQALRAIVTERMEQVTKHGFTLDHDQAHPPDEIVQGALAYATAAGLLLRDRMQPGRALATAMPLWPWPDLFKPTDARGNLVKAVAMLWAAIDRLDHAQPDHTPGGAMSQGDEP